MSSFLIFLYNACILKVSSVFLGFRGVSAGKESAHVVGDLVSIPRLGISPGEGNGYPLEYFGLENSMDCSPGGFKGLGTIEWLFTFTHSLCVSKFKGYIKIHMNKDKWIEILIFLFYVWEKPGYASLSNDLTMTFCKRVYTPKKKVAWFFIN